MNVHLGKFSLQFVACAFIWACASRGLAVVNYIEAVHGELPHTGSPLPTLSLGVGVNTVSGTLASGTSFLDSFAFTVPVGSELISGQVVVARESMGNITSTRWLLSAGSANAGVGASLENLDVSPPGSDSLLSVPLGPNVYNILNTVIVASQPVQAAYTFTLIVQPVVPEPSSAGLWLVATAGGLLMRRHR